MKFFSKEYKKGWRTVVSSLLEFKREICILSLLGIISALTNGTIPYFIGKFFDHIMLSEYFFKGTSYTLPSWLFYLIVFGLVQSIADIFNWINARRYSKISLQIRNTYIARGYGFLLLLPLSFHKNNKTGNTFTYIERGGNDLANLIEHVILRLSPQFLSIFIGLAFAFTINIHLTLLLLAGILLYIISLCKAVKPLVKLTDKANDAWGKAYGYSYESIMNYEAIKHFGTEQHETKKIHKYFVDGAAKLWYKIEKAWSDIDFFQRIIITGTRLCIFAASVYLIHNNSITLGGLITLNGYALMVFGPFSALGYQWQKVQNGVISIHKAESILQTPTEQYIPKQCVHKKHLNGDIVFDDVSFYYKSKEQPILDNISFNVKAGEVIALVGESGVGKSTLIQLLSGYYFPTKGSITIDGITTKQLNLHMLRKNIATVPQEVVLFNDSILQNIKYGNFSKTTKDVLHASQQAHAHQFIEKLPKKYNQKVGERGVKLSVGQKQRIAIARAILRDPSILILDEPTSALDPKLEHEITKTLNKLMQGKTTFIIAHRLSTVRKADRILVFKDGKIVEQGTHMQLIKKKDGVYKKLYELHIGLN